MHLPVKNKNFENGFSEEHVEVSSLSGGDETTNKNISMYQWSHTVWEMQEQPLSDNMSNMQSSDEYSLQEHICRTCCWDNIS